VPLVVLSSSRYKHDKTHVDNRIEQNVLADQKKIHVADEPDVTRSLYSFSFRLSRCQLSHRPRTATRRRILGINEGVQSDKPTKK
jgi:hypothetical protein